MTSVVGLDRLLWRLGAWRKLGSRDLFNRVGEYLASSIKKRTLAGRDVAGRAFRPYAKSYRAFRVEQGRPVSRVDLCFSGSMQAALTWKAEEDEVRLGFLETVDARGASNAAKAASLNQTRPFFAIADEENAQVHRMFRAHLESL